MQEDGSRQPKESDSMETTAISMIMVMGAG